MSKVFTLSEAVSIGLHGIVLIAKSEGMLNVQKIADATNTSRHHVAKVMQRLVKDNFLSSVRGPRGGFSLKKEPTDITLLEVFEAIEGKIDISKCPLDNPVCPFENCILGDIGKKLSTEFVEYLGNQTLASYI